MRRRTLAAAVGVLLIAGCTTPVAPAATPTPGTTLTSVPDGRGPTPEKVNVRLVIQSDQPTTVRFSDGVNTSTAILAGPNQVIEFEAPTPWAVAGTAVKNTPGFLACHLYINGELASTFDRDEAFARCGASEKRAGNDEPAHDTYPVSMKMTTLSGAWVAWTSSHTGGEETSSPGNMTLSTNQADGHARMIVISALEPDDATCEITVDGFRMAADDVDDLGDIATCSAVAEHPLFDDQHPEPTSS